MIVLLSGTHDYTAHAQFVGKSTDDLYLGIDTRTVTHAIIVKLLLLLLYEYNKPRWDFGREGVKYGREKTSAKRRRRPGVVRRKTLIVTRIFKANEAPWTFFFFLFLALVRVFARLYDVVLYFRLYEI